MTLKHRARTLMQDRLGVDIQRFPGNSDGHRLVQLLRTHGVEVVIDVGANDGGYGKLLRRHGYDHQIVSFEPLERPWSILQGLCVADPKWTGLRAAIGLGTGKLTINVAGNAGASSSVLPMLPRHSSAAPEANYVGTQVVPVAPLGEALRHFGREPETFAAPHHLKVDVQGFEKEVLRGAADVLASPHLVGLQMELSLVPLYEGAWTWREAVDFAESYGFRVEAMLPGFSDPQSGQMLQVDGVFFR